MTTLITSQAVRVSRRIVLVSAFIGAAIMIGFWLGQCCSRTLPPSVTEQTIQRNVEVVTDGYLLNETVKAAIIEIEDSIAKLVSPNEVPLWPDGDIRHQPQVALTYDTSADRVVFKARALLRARGVGAFPQLVEHCDDERYSMTFMKSFWRNYNVGQVCQNLIKEKVEVYTLVVKDEPGARLPSWISENRTFKEWWQDNKYKTLCDMQIEGCEWALRRYQESRCSGVSEDERIAAIPKLEALLARLRQSKKPIEVPDSLAWTVKVKAPVGAERQ